MLETQLGPTIYAAALFYLGDKLSGLVWMRR